jgi:hypothetical protein
MGKPRSKIERSFHRNGTLREEVSFLGRQLHGAYRTWHPNGRLASEEFYEEGRLHGLCRQWNARGKLLGSFRLKHGTGIQREWFENGQLQLETSTVAGQFTGRTRVWLRDGVLVSEQFAIENRNVTPAAYAAVAIKHEDYPRYPASKTKKKFPDESEIERREFQLHIEWLLAQKNKREALAWLKAGAQARSLGLLKLTQARELVQKLYDAGALQIFAADIYDEKKRKQFSDVLLVKLPLEKSARQTIRRLLVKLPVKLRAGVLPIQDHGEEFLFASFV